MGKNKFAALFRFLLFSAAVGISFLSFKYLDLVVAISLHVITFLFVAVEIQILHLYSVIFGNQQQSKQPENQETYSNFTVNSVEFKDSCLSFRENQLYLLIKNGNLDPSANYDAVLQFLQSRAKNKTLLFKDMPSDLIPILVDKAYNTANSEIQFENIDNIFDNNENS